MSGLCQITPTDCLHTQHRDGRVWRTLPESELHTATAAAPTRQSGMVSRRFPTELRHRSRTGSPLPLRHRHTRMYRTTRRRRRQSSATAGRLRRRLPPADSPAPVRRQQRHNAASEFPRIACRSIEASLYGTRPFPTLATPVPTLGHERIGRAGSARRLHDRLCVGAHHTHRRRGPARPHTLRFTAAPGDRLSGPRARSLLLCIRAFASRAPATLCATPGAVAFARSLHRAPHRRLLA